MFWRPLWLCSGFQCNACVCAGTLKRAWYTAVTWETWHRHRSTTSWPTMLRSSSHAPRLNRNSSSLKDVRDREPLSLSLETELMTRLHSRKPTSVYILLSSSSSSSSWFHIQQVNGVKLAVLLCVCAHSTNSITNEHYVRCFDVLYLLS